MEAIRGSWLFIDMLKPESFENKPLPSLVSPRGSGAARPVEHLQQVFGYRNALNFNERVFIHKFTKLLIQKLAHSTALIEELLETKLKFSEFCTSAQI